MTQLVLAMPPERFEVLIRELLIRMGFDENTVKATPYSGDGGIDVTSAYRTAGLTEMSAAVQVKRWKGNVGAPVVTQLRGSLQVHQQGIIVTTGDFSKSAGAEAVAPNKTRIGLISGAELIELLVKHQVGVVKRTLEVTALDDEYWANSSARPGRPLSLRPWGRMQPRLIPPQRRRRPAPLFAELVRAPAGRVPRPPPSSQPYTLRRPRQWRGATHCRCAERPVACSVNGWAGAC